MAKKVYDKADWEIFREDVLDLVILYKHVKEYSSFDKEKIEYIESFFHFSRNNAITSFYIKLGFLLSHGKPTFQNFMEHDDFIELNKIYKSKLKDMRDKVYAHNAKTQLPENFKVTNKDVDLLFSKIISSAQKIDEKFNDQHDYQDVGNSDGIKSIEPYIKDSIELDNLQSELIKNGYKGSVKVDTQTGKIIVIK